MGIPDPTSLNTRLDIFFLKRKKKRQSYIVFVILQAGHLPGYTGLACRHCCGSCFFPGASLLAGLDTCSVRVPSRPPHLPTLFHMSPIAQPVSLFLLWPRCYQSPTESDRVTFPKVNRIMSFPCQNSPVASWHPWNRI